jgi:MFS family permease
MKLNNFKSWFEDRNLSSLCFAAFMMSAALGIFLVALPFIVKRLGGSDGDVGLSVALNFFAYLAACMIGMVLLDRFNPKRILQVGVAGIVVSLVGLVLTVIFADKSRASIWILNLFSMLLGVLTAMYWPPLM